MLHTVNKSPDHSALRQCLSFMVDDDALVLIEDGVYCALPGNDFNDWLDQPITVYAILADIEARGLLGRLDPRVAMIDYPQFVSLCVTHLVSKRWS